MPALSTLLALGLALVACDEEPTRPPVENEVASVTVEPATDTIVAGDTTRFFASVRDSAGQTLTGPQPVWSSEDTAVAVVDAQGLVTGVAPGQTIVAAEAGGHRGEATLVVLADDDDNGEPGPPTLELVADGFSLPIQVTYAPGDTSRLFVVEQGGRIRIIRDGQVRSTPFLDVSGLTIGAGERGLLSMAFHPDYANNGRFFISYTNLDRDTRIAEYAVSGDPDVADAGSARIVLGVDQPFGNHNGGLIVFGPDGYLYVGLGDGGGSGDPQNHGQDRSTLHGAILRIDVDGAEPYEIPADNPFVGEAGASDEIWAWGLRNPWRFGFDPVTGDLYIADVGQNRWEEVNVEPAGDAGGRNYGWNIMEASECFGASTCDTTGLTLPVYAYPTNVEGCAVTGGEVYRGEALPELDGLYFFGDYCAGWIRSFRYAGGQATDVRDWTPEFGTPGSITSFGRDARGAVYVVTHGGGIYRIAPSTD